MPPDTPRTMFTCQSLHECAIRCARANEKIVYEIEAHNTPLTCVSPSFADHEPADTLVCMGFLMYGGTQEFEFEDRTLAHLKIAVTTKLRRRECFLLSWRNGTEKGGGRVSLWMSPSIPLTFRFAGSKPPQLNQLWLEKMMMQANSPNGLQVSEEPKTNG